jgi:hypothetical protein
LIDLKYLSQRSMKLLGLDAVWISVSAEVKKGQAGARFDLYALVEPTGFEPHKAMELNK